MKRVLYLSELAEADVLRSLGLPLEGDFLPPWFADLGAALTVCDATAAPPPDPLGFDGVVVGGSFGSANDVEPWRVRLLDWMRDLRETPYFGICGGHQLWAVARGGRVAPMRGPRQVGLFPLDLPGVPGWERVVFQMHGDAVVDLPPDASVWAEDDRGIQALRYPGHTWTVQFHPEFPPDEARVAARHCTEPLVDWDDENLARTVAGGRALLAAWIAGL